MNRALILDCFVDEPACFGVPPFISPYPRYLYGALLDGGLSPESIDYRTIDAVREKNYAIDGTYDAVFLIGGAVVPGKYLGERIGTFDEIVRITETNRAAHIVIGGLAGRLIGEQNRKNVTAISRDLEQYAYTFAKGDAYDTLRSYADLDRWAAAGAVVVKRHPGYPHLIAEIESYRGCPRQSHCSFCSEGLFPSIDTRSVKGIIAEIDALIAAGISRFRIGRQADIIAYGTTMNEYRNGFPRPEPAAVEELFGELKKRREDGRITTLNIDNANPGTIANFPEESARVIRAICAALTPGDTMPLGVESFDPVVCAKNNLKVSRDEAIRVVSLINEIGGFRVDGLPVLLPGINLIHGLAGESMESFSLNYEALKKMRDEGLMLKRINIRTLAPFPGTAAARETAHHDMRIENRYDYYRKKIRAEIDHVMLERIYPPGTLLRGLRVVEIHPPFSYARQIQSYAITVKIPFLLESGSFIDAVTVAYSERSLIALPLPIRMNDLPAKALELIPGIGKRTAGEIVIHRPVPSIETLLRYAPSIDPRVAKYLVF
jgi:radical SAM superfamily enzyme with C-terminal helix-hairpin-helix motif